MRHLRPGRVDRCGQRARSPINPFWIVLVGFVAVAVAGCAGVPSEDLRAYAGAYDQAKTAGVQVYKEYLPSALIQQQQAAEAAGAAPDGGIPSVADDPYLVEFLGPRKWVSAAPGTCDVFKDAPDVLARCDALAAVSDYNQVLLRLDSGESAAALTGQVAKIKGVLDGLTGLAATTPAAPFLVAGSVLFAPLSAILGEALTLRDRAILRAKLNEGAPLVAEILARLRTDAATVFYAQYDQTRLLLGDERSAAMLNANDMLGTVAGLQPPSGALASATDSLGQRYEAAVAKLGSPRPFTLASQYGALGNGAFGADHFQDLTTSLERLEAAADRHEALVESWRAFSEALRQYDAMLAAVEHSHSTLVARSNDPFAPGGGSIRLIESLTAVRDHALEIDRLLGSQ